MIARVDRAGRRPVLERVQARPLHVGAVGLHARRLVQALPLAVGEQVVELVVGVEAVKRSDIC